MGSCPLVEGYIQASKAAEVPMVVCTFQMAGAFHAFRALVASVNG